MLIRCVLKNENLLAKHWCLTPLFLFGLVLFLLFLLLMPGNVHAEAQTPAPETTNTVVSTESAPAVTTPGVVDPPGTDALLPTLPASNTGEPSLWRLLLALVFVLVMIFVAAWLIRRSPLRNMQGAIKIVSSMSLGAREKLVLVQVGEQQLLLGVTPTQINLLQTLAQPVPTEVTGTAPRFADALALVLKGNKA